MTRRTAAKDELVAFERSYLTALRKHMNADTDSDGAGRIGRRALNLGIETLALARIHERAVAALMPGAGAVGRVRRAESFFAEAVAPVEAAHCGVAELRTELKRLDKQLDRRTSGLGAARARLAGEVARRKELAAECKEVKRQHDDLRAQAGFAEKRMRSLSHRILTAQEEERLRISRDLHDAIGETLTGINVDLATLKGEAASHSRELAEAISKAQRLVERSMKNVHQFAWELRPTLLDDLGLIPALRSYTQAFSERTGLTTHFRTGEGLGPLGRLNGDGSIALFRVAQGALSNVERHAEADRARVTLRSIPSALRLEVNDNGRSFDTRSIEKSNAQSNLGLLVMRERVEMVDGTFSIISSPRRGTTVRADVPRHALSRG